MSHFSLDYVVDYFSRDQVGGSKLLNIERPGRVQMVGVRRVKGPTVSIPGVIGNHHPDPGQDQVYEDQGSMRVGDELIFAKGPQLYAASEDGQNPGDQLLVLIAEQGLLRVTDNADGLYRVAILGITYPHTATSETITEIRDGLLTSIGTPVGLSVAASGTDAILIVGSVAGQDLKVVPTPDTLTYIRTRYRNDRFEIWKAQQWTYGQYSKYTGRLMRQKAGV